MGCLISNLGVCGGFRQHNTLWRLYSREMIQKLIVSNYILIMNLNIYLQYTCTITERSTAKNFERLGSLLFAKACLWIIENLYWNAHNISCNEFKNCIVPQHCKEAVNFVQRCIMRNLDYVTTEFIGVLSIIQLAFNLFIL